MAERTTYSAHCRDGGRTPLETEALAYLHANCAHCHNGEEVQEPGARYPHLDLRYHKVIENTVNLMTMTIGTTSGIRVVPGDPANSFLLQSMMALDKPVGDVKAMPPVGVDRGDAQGIDLVDRWIRSLP